MTCHISPKTASEKFENVALFLRLGLPTTPIRHAENEPEEFENDGLAF